MTPTPPEVKPFAAPEESESSPLDPSVCSPRSPARLALPEPRVSPSLSLGDRPSPEPAADYSLPRVRQHGAIRRARWRIFDRSRRELRGSEPQGHEFIIDVKSASISSRLVQHSARISQNQVDTGCLLFRTPCLKWLTAAVRRPPSLSFPNARSQRTGNSHSLASRRPKVMRPIVEANGCAI
jgi:hypothetical protein